MIQHGAKLDRNGFFWKEVRHVTPGAESGCLRIYTVAALSKHLFFHEPDRKLDILTSMIANKTQGKHCTTGVGAAPSMSSGLQMWSQRTE
jgi:hypothetical protein